MRRAALPFALSAALLAPELPARPVGPAGGATEVKLGEPFPELLLPSLADGSPLSIRHFRGRKLLLLQFASW